MLKCYLTIVYGRPRFGFHASTATASTEETENASAMDTAILVYKKRLPPSVCSIVVFAGRTVVEGILH